MHIHFTVLHMFNSHLGASCELLAAKTVIRSPILVIVLSYSFFFFFYTCVPVPVKLLSKILCFLSSKWNFFITSFALAVKLSTSIGGCGELTG